MSDHWLLVLSEPYRPLLYRWELGMGDDWKAVVEDRGQKQRPAHITEYHILAEKGAQAIRPEPDMPFDTLAVAKNQAQALALLEQDLEQKRSKK